MSVCLSSCGSGSPCRRPQYGHSCERLSSHSSSGLSPHSLPVEGRERRKGGMRQRGGEMRGREERGLRGRKEGGRLRRNEGIEEKTGEGENGGKQTKAAFRQAAQL